MGQLFHYAIVSEGCLAIRELPRSEHKSFLPMPWGIKGHANTFKTTW